MLGAIVYSVYKRQKIETIQDFEKKNGRKPTEQDLNHFKDLSNSESQIKFYQDEALRLAQYFLDEIEPQISKKICQDILKKKSSFWYGVSQSLVASVLFVLVVGIIFFFTLSYNMRLNQILTLTWDKIDFGKGFIYLTNMRTAGVPESVIMEITGHATREMFDRYNTVDELDKRQAVEKMCGFLQKCCQSVAENG